MGEDPGAVGERSATVPLDDRRFYWLASYPKSGNTWVRALIGCYLTDGPVDINNWPRMVDNTDLRPVHYQAVSPRPLGILEPSQLLHLRGAAMQHVLCQPDPLFVKTHSCRLSAAGMQLIPPEMTRKAVYIVRNPWDVAVSFAYHMDYPFADTVEMMGQDAACLTGAHSVGLFHVLGPWDQHLRSWAQHEDTLVVRYEDLLEQPDAELRKVMEFLGFLVDGERIERAVDHADFTVLSDQEQRKGFLEARKGTFFRSGEIAWGQELPAELRGTIRVKFGETIDAYYPECPI